MSLKHFLTFVTFLSVASAFAQTNHMLFMGGGGEPRGDKTIFDPEIGNLGDFIQESRKWNVTSSFNGGHPTTEGIIAQKISNQNQSFTATSFENLMRDYEARLTNGTIKPGDQLLVQLSSHGAMQGINEKTHSLSTSEGTADNLNTLKGSKTVSLDRLQNLINLAAQKGVKLAIVDFSCHSGNSLALSNPNTCIISGTGPQHFGWAGPNTFSSQFTDSMKPGKSLEQVFIEAMGKKTDPGFPMISSPVGKGIQDEMYKDITPFLYQWNPEANKDKFVKYIETEAIENKCQEQPEFRQIMNFSNQVEAILSTSDRHLATAFRQAIKDYYDFQFQIRSDLDAMNLPQMRQDHEFCSPATAKFPSGKSYTQRVCDHRRTEELVSTDFPRVREMINNQLRIQKNPIESSILQAQLENLKKAEEKFHELQGSTANIAKYKEYYRNFPDLEKQSQELANKVAKEAAGLYSKLYQLRSGTSTEKNPCKDFIL